MAILVSLFVAGWFAAVIMGLLHHVEERRQFNKLLQEAGFRKIDKDTAVKKDEKPKEKIASAIAKISIADKITKYLYQAGLPLRIEEFTGIYLVVFIISLALVIYGKIYFGFLLVVVSLIIPLFWVSSARRKRLRVFNEQLGDALILMANSLKAGFSFLQAMDLVGKEMPAPLGNEFSKVMNEVQLGVPVEIAMDNLVKQIASDDLDMVVTAVLIQRQVGGNLAEVLQKIATTIKERARIRGEIKTLTAQGKISGLIIGMLPIVLAVVLTVINPDYISVLISDPIGPFLIVGGIASQLLGVFFIKKVVTIDV